MGKYNDARPVNLHCYHAFDSVTETSQFLSTYRPPSPKTYPVFLDTWTKPSFRYLRWDIGRVKVFIFKTSILKPVL